MPPPRPDARPLPGQRAPHRLYDLALSEAERLQLDEARRVEGFDEEVAVLRVRLRRLLEERPEEEMRLLLQAVALLVRAAAVKHRLSPAAADDLSRGLASVIAQIGDVLLPEEARERDG